ncbi:PD-(D/E)XK nuclease family protein [Marivirga tractuosa]|uniref:PDDEXK-like family protein n=1 Tax=Marivirga tractuosa TaxID=1006 RepID=UPI0035CF29C5
MGEIKTEFDVKKHYLNLVNDIDYDQLELQLEAVTFFEIIGASKAEIRHSNFLAWLLDPKASHGLGETILKRFLRQLFSDDRAKDITEIEVENLNYQSVNILREWQHIDLFIEFDNLVIALENKLYSKEHSKQLTRYFDIVEQEYKGIKKTVYGFLTPEGIEAIDESDKYVSISYFEIAEIIERVIQIRGSTLGENASVYINDYLKTLKRHVMDNDQSIELAQKIYKSHKDILDFIFENKPDERGIVTDYFRKLINQKGFKEGSRNKRFLRFSTDTIKSILPEYKQQKGGWSNNEPLLIEFSFWKDDHISLKIVLSPHPLAEILQNIILEINEAEPSTQKAWPYFLRKTMGINYYDIGLELDEKLKENANRFLDDYKTVISKLEEVLKKNKEKIADAYNNNQY